MKRKKKTWNLQTKLLFSHFSIISVLICALLVYFYFYVMNSEQAKALRSLNTLSSKISEQLDTVIYNMDKTALQIADNPFIVQEFERLPAGEPGNYFEQDPLYTHELVNYINSYNFKKNVTARICLYNDSGDFIYSGTRITSTSAVSEYFESDEFSELHDYYHGDLNHFTYYIAPREDPFTVPNDRLDDQLMFSVVREIKNYDILWEVKSLGYVEVQHPLIRMTELFDSLDPSVSGYILDEKNRIIYTTADAESSDLFMNVYLDLCAASPQAISQRAENTLISASPMNELDYTVVLAQPCSTITASLTTFWFLLFAAAILIIILVTASDYLILRHLTKSLIRLQKSVESINLNHLSWELIPDGSNDEIQRINEAFDRMFHRLQNSIDELLETKTSEFESSLMALQAQMNPHFLYNILTIISLQAADKQTENIPQICDTLSQMLRYTASYQDMLCSIQEEINYTKNYLELMKFRYEDRFIYEIETDALCGTVQVPKLILQPLAENCFQHAFKNKRPPWKIKICAHCNESLWEIQIEDNGSGFDRQALENFEHFKTDFDVQNAKEKMKSLQIGGLCLVNIFLRLKLLYKGDVWFLVASSPEVGTVITIGGKIL
ncbi:MAG: histidine kinase [Lachnospiraceae bacterium]|nr:histidine kinase [Lachnospiraceae bacterium]